jgi:hypothetical protein
MYHILVHYIFNDQSLLTMDHLLDKAHLLTSPVAKTDGDILSFYGDMAEQIDNSLKATALSFIRFDNGNESILCITFADRVASDAWNASQNTLADFLNLRTSIKPLLKFDTVTHEGTSADLAPNTWDEALALWSKFAPTPNAKV